MINIEQLFQMMNNPGLNAPKQKHTKIIVPHDFMVSEQEFNSYTNEIKTLYQQVFSLPTDTQENKNKEINLESKLFFQSRQTPMPICNKILSANQSVYRCYDCMTHEASVLCKKCFENGNHKGHRYSQIASGGGNCDCGNPDAINPVGFCVDHPGKAEPVIVDKKEENHFLDVIGVVLQWIFRLHEKEKSKSSDVLGQQLADFLLKLNDKSLYYNTLTFGLLFKRRVFGATELQRQSKVIDKIFEYGVKLLNFARKITDVFLNMFSLDVFKYELTISFTQAYNKFTGFETSKFKSLYIQLFANNDVVMKMLDEKRLVLYPSKQYYDFTEYIQNLMFLGTIKPQVASKFFLILNEIGWIDFPQMDNIEKKVQKPGGEHIVGVINNILNIENYYYMAIQTTVGFVQESEQGLIQMLKRYIDAIMSTKYSYKKNKVIMPFHKVLSMILLAMSKGDLSSLSAKKLQKMIDNKYSIKQVFTKIFKLIMECFREFSKTFFQTSYFDNYIPLYVKSGNTIVVFDLLMVSICAQMFEELQCQNQMNEILMEVFEIRIKEKQEKKEIEQKQPQIKKTKSVNQKSNHNESMQDEDPWMDIEDGLISESINEESYISSQSLKQKPLTVIKKSLQMMRILIECCISDRPLILISNSIKLKSQTLKTRTEQYFIQVMNNFKQITPENLKLINKNFIETKNLEEDLIKNFLTFDKTKKKYTLNDMKDERFSNKRVPLFLYPTMKKFGGIFAEQVKEPIENLLVEVKLPKDKIMKLKFIFNETFIDSVSRQFLRELTTDSNYTNKQFTKTFFDFMEVLKILEYLMRQDTPFAIRSFYQRIYELSNKPDYEFLSEKIMRKQSQELMNKEKMSNKLKFEEKKKKKLQKIKKMQQSYDHVIEEKPQENQNQSVCLICREDNNQGLCLLSQFNYSNILQAFNKASGRSLVFDSCFHPIHIQCFIKSSKSQYLPCPLCKNESNIMLPSEKQLHDQKTVLEVFERITTLKATFQDKYEGFDKDFREFGILSIFRALSAMICKNLLRFEPILDNKDQRVANILYGVSKTVVIQGLSQAERNQEAKAFQNFLQLLEQYAQYEKSQSTNFYAAEYVTLKILHYSFIQKSNSCTEVLKSHLVKLINKQDLKKIWQMCDQIVSLPVFQEPTQSFAVKQMSSVVKIYSPPSTVFQLIKLRDTKEMSCKNGHQICICLICQTKCCYDCKEVRKHFREIHCGEGLSFNLVTGGMIYVSMQKMVQIPSLYTNQMGFEWKPSKSPEGFSLDQEKYHQLKSSILNESIVLFLLRNYPDLLKKNLFMDLNVL